MKPTKQVIHFVHLSAGPGGIEVLLPKIAEYMGDREFKAFTLRPEPASNVYDQSGLKVCYGSNNNLAAALKIFSYIRKNRNNVFHVFNIGPFFLLTMRLAGVKNLVYSIHGTVYWKALWKKKILKFLWKLALADRFIFTANSAFSRQAFLNRISTKPDIRVLYNPIDGKRFALSNQKKSSEEIKVIYTGRLHTGKNLFKWIDIAVSLHAKIPVTRFEIFGQGNLKEELQQKINEQNASGFIHLMGFRTNIEDVYREADLLLFLSEYESFGNVVVESILCGTPVLCSPIPAMEEIFSEYPMFIIEDEQNWEEQIYNRILALPELRTKALEARTRFLEKFSMEQHTRTLREIYNGFK